MQQPRLLWIRHQNTDVAEHGPYKVAITRDDCADGRDVLLTVRIECTDGTEGEQFSVAVPSPEAAECLRTLKVQIESDIEGRLDFPDELTAPSAPPDLDLGFPDEQTRPATPPFIPDAEAPAAGRYAIKFKRSGPKAPR